MTYDVPSSVVTVIETGTTTTTTTTTAAATAVAAATTTIRWLGGAAVMMLEYQSKGCEFDSRSDRYPVFTTVCREVSNITNTKVNSAFHPSGVGKSSTGLFWLGLRRVTFTCVGWQVTLCDPIWQVTLRSSAMGFP